jgi:hypothetical protein
LWFGDAPRPEVIPLDNSVYLEPGATDGCNVTFTDDGFTINVTADTFETAFWIRNIDTGKRAFDNNAPFHMGRYSIEMEGLKYYGINGKWYMDLYDVGTSVNYTNSIQHQHAHGPMGRIRPYGVGIEPEAEDTFITVAHHPGDGGRYVNIRVFVKGHRSSTVEDPKITVKRLRLLEHPLQQEPTPQVPSVAHRQGIIPKIDQILPGKHWFWARFYPFGVTRMTEIRGIDNDYHPICVGVYLQDQTLYADILNSYTKPDNETTMKTLTDAATGESYTFRRFSRSGYNSHSYITSPQDGDYTISSKSITTISKEFGDRLIFGTKDSHIAVCNGPNSTAIGAYRPYRTHIKHLAQIPDEVYGAIANSKFFVVPEIHDYDEDFALYIHPDDNRLASYLAWSEAAFDDIALTGSDPPKWIGPYNTKNWFWDYGYTCTDMEKVDEDGNPLEGILTSGYSNESIIVPVCEGASPDNGYSIVIRVDHQVGTSTDALFNVSEETYNDASESWETYYSNNSNPEFSAAKTSDSLLGTLGGIVEYFTTVDGELVIVYPSKWKSDTILSDISVTYPDDLITEFDNTDAAFDSTGVTLLSSEFTVLCDNDNIEVGIDKESPDSNTYVVVSRVSKKGDYLWNPKVHSGWYIIDSKEGFLFAQEHNVSIVNNTDVDISMESPSPKNQAPVFIDVGPILEPTSEQPCTLFKVNAERGEV